MSCLGASFMKGLVRLTLLLVVCYQIDEWLSHRPSDMESFIRPGCVILTVFLSMPKPAWIEVTYFLVFYH